MLGWQAISGLKRKHSRVHLYCYGATVRAHGVYKFKGQVGLKNKSSAASRTSNTRVKTEVLKK
jgi:hypothetical protein